MFESGENARFGESYARRAKEKNCFVELKERVEKLLAVVRNENFNVVLFKKTCTGKSNVMKSLLGGEILPSGCGQVTSNVCCIVGASVERIGHRCGLERTRRGVELGR